MPILNRLEREGWVNRSVSAEDKRAHSLVLTESGLTKLDELQAAVTSLQDRMSARIGGDGQMEMLKLLRLIQSVAEGGKPACFPIALESTRLDPGHHTKKKGSPP